MKKIIILIALAAVCFSAFAQLEKPVDWSYAAKKLNTKEAVIFIKATIHSGWHIYSMNQVPGGPDKTVFKFLSSKDFSLTGKVSEPQPIKKFEEVFDINVLYFEKSVVFQQKIKLNKGSTVVKGSVEFMACTDKQCLPLHAVNFNIPVK